MASHLRIPPAVFPVLSGFRWLNRLKSRTPLEQKRNPESDSLSVEIIVAHLPITCKKLINH